MNELKSVASRSVALIGSPPIRRLLIVQLGWTATVLFLLWLADSFSFESFYVLSYFGLVVSALLFAPEDPTERWWRELQWILLAGFLGLCYFVARRILDTVDAF